MGYDVSNPIEVIPEYSSDFGIKKGEKVDYALFVNNQPFIILEAKDCRNDLTQSNVSQLYRYFSVTDAKIAILTNGIEYRFYTDSKEKNKMDKEPFFCFNILDFNESDVITLENFSRSNAQSRDVLSFLREKMAVEKVANFFKAQSSEPSAVFINFIKTQLSDESLTNRSISVAIKDVLSGRTSRIEPTDGGIEIDIESASTEKKAKVNGGRSTGVTGVFALNVIDYPKYCVGSKIIGVSYYPEFPLREISSYFELFVFVIDYLMDKQGYSKESICNLNDGSISSAIFSQNSEDFRVAGEHRGIFFEKNISAADIIRYTKYIATTADMFLPEFKVYLCSRSDYSRMRSLSYDWSRMLQEVESSYSDFNF